MDTHPNYGLTKTKEETSVTEELINLLPRAVLRSNSFVLLSGEWHFSLDLHDKGIQESWHLGHEYENVAQWPGSIEQHIATAKGELPAWNDKVVAWYEREFPLPERTQEEIQNSILQLTFGACGYKTQVWLNGIALKTIEGELVHVGEYTSFSYELREGNLKSNNRLTVRIEDNMDADTTRGKQESHVYKRGGIWYQTYTGAVREIWIESVERNRLRSRVGVFSIVEDNLVRFTLTMRIHDPGDYVIRLNISERKGSEIIATSDFPIRLEAGQRNQRLVIEVPDAKLWSPEDPHLYLLQASLIDSKGVKAVIETHFGLRKIESRGAGVYLNNKSIYLDGILYQPGIATYEEIKKHMYAMKELGCNLVRIHIAGVDPRIYNLADKLGLLLWVEVPSPHRSSAISRQNHKEELHRMLSMIVTHPSVVIWSLYNEDWGAQDIATNKDTQQYIIEMYHFMQLAHPQFLVVDNDGWQHVSFEGRLKSDLLTVHLYTPELERWKEQLDKLIGGENTGIAAFPLVVGDPFYYRMQVPLIISEWGGFGFKDYGGPKDDEARVTQITLFKNELRKRNIAGDVYTQATNIEDEKNGLIDPQSGALNVPKGLLKSGLNK
ncbi:MAG: sugar-binding domain-containing protein [Ferruginibacter sp.]